MRAVPRVNGGVRPPEENGPIWFHDNGGKTSVVPGRKPEARGC